MLLRYILRRLVVAWSGCYVSVTPLMVHTLWNHLASTLKFWVFPKETPWESTTVSATS